jgi:hypothetical protein
MRILNRKSRKKQKILNHSENSFSQSGTLNPHWLKNGMEKIPSQITPQSRYSMTVILNDLFIFDIILSESKTKINFPEENQSRISKKVVSFSRMLK